MANVHGFVVPVPEDKIGAYKGMARRVGEVWKEYGALAFVECLGDDVPYGELTASWARPGSPWPLVQPSAMRAPNTMTQRSAEAIQFPDDQTIARPEERQRFCETGAIVPAAADVIVEQVALVDPGGKKRVALKVEHLPVIGRGDAHIAHEHVRKTYLDGSPHIIPSRVIYRAYFRPHEARFCHFRWPVGKQVFSVIASALAWNSSKGGNPLLLRRNRSCSVPPMSAYAYQTVFSLLEAVTALVRDYVASTNGLLTRHVLPGYAPELNPDELVWSRMKRTGVARTPLRKGERSSDKIDAQLAAIKRMPQLVRSFFKAPCVAYISDC